MDKSKLIIIILAVLVVLTLGVTVYLAITVTGLTKAINTPEQETKTVDMGVVPLAERTEYIIEDSFVGQYNKLDSDGHKKVVSVSLEIGLSVHNTEKDAEDVLANLADKEKLVRSRISTLMDEKEYDFMVNEDAKEVLMEEILEVLQVTFDTDSIIEVYGEMKKIEE